MSLHRGMRIRAAIVLTLSNTAFADPDSKPIAASASQATRYDVTDRQRNASVEPYQVSVVGLVQADGLFLLGKQGTSTFLIRRARPDLRAKLGKHLGLRLQLDAAGGKLVLFDAYGTLRLNEALQLQFGKMKSPIGLELLQVAASLALAERGFTSALEPNRDVGAELFGRAADGVIEYELGIFNGVADGTNGDEDENNAKDVTGRFFSRPLVNSGLPLLAGLGAGLAGSYGREAGALPAHRSPGRQTFFSYAAGAKADGVRSRIAPQGYWYAGPVGILAEYVRSVEAVSNGTTSRTLATQAWQVWGSVVIGGRPTYGETQLDAPFSPLAGTWGALEVSARISVLSLGSAAFRSGLADADQAARRARDTGVALSWWLAKGTRALFSLDRTSFLGGAPNADRRPETALVTRFQVSL